jgi:methyltransferase (TIGR00027 family)
VIYACGYDTFSLRTANQALTVYELDRPEMIEDRRMRIARAGLEPVCRAKSIGCDLSKSIWKESLIEAGLDAERPSFSSLLGISYYLTGEAFENLIAGIASISCEGASLCFDYPMNAEGGESVKNRALAAAAGEAMKSRYTYSEMEALLYRTGFLICAHLDADKATDAFFKESGMIAPAGVGYCLAVRK